MVFISTLGSEYNDPTTRPTLCANGLAAAQEGQKVSESQSTSGRVVRLGTYPEITWPAVIAGWVIGALITLSIGYLSLKLGFSIEGSELAAILGFGVLRGLMGRHSIIENNINQTIASAVNGASAGMMFSVPALFILSVDDPGYLLFNRPLVVLGCIAGGILGIAFVIPLRKQMIDFNRLAFPGGIATAAILRAPGAGIRKAQLLVGAAVVSGAIHFLSLTSGIDNWNLGAALGMPEYMNGIWYLSLLTIGTAYLAGRGGFFFAVGGLICYWILAPVLSLQGLLPNAETLAESGMGIANYLRVVLFRPVGIGMLIGGALMGIVLAMPLVVSAIRSMQSAAKTKTAVSQDELPIHLLYMAIAVAFVVLALIAINSTQEMGWIRGIVMAVLGTLWIWVAGVVLAECIGRTNWSPLSGMTLIGVTILVFVASGLGTTATVVAAVVVGAAMCVSMAQATDLMLDLKTGYLVGATPKKQQIAQLLGTWLGPILVMALIVVLHKAHGIGSDALPAPQGQALATVIQGVMGGDVPIAKYAAGAGLGAILSASGIGGLGVLVGLGFYMPFNIVLTYAVGTLIRVATDWKLGHSFADSVGIPVAAGFIVGEALVGVGHALAVVIGG